MKTTVCTCSFCRKGEYDPSEYMVDIAGFAKERPVGVSGLMRVKNEARWVAQSIDTCIDALDELIICYQSCSDETPWIIEQKRRQYPDKIKVFFMRLRYFHMIYRKRSMAMPAVYRKTRFIY